MSIKDKYGLLECADLTLTDADDEPMLGSDGKPCTVTLWGPGTKQHNRARAYEQNQMTVRFQKRGSNKLSAEDIPKDRMQYALFVIKNFSANLVEDLAPGMEAGADQFEKILSDPDVGYLICEKINTEQRKNENFKKGSTPA